MERPSATGAGEYWPRAAEYSHVVHSPPLNTMTESNPHEKWDGFNPKS
jgi:hypothetical protein